MAFKFAPGSLPNNVSLNLLVAGPTVLLVMLSSFPSYGQRPPNLPPDTIPPIDRGPRPEPSSPSQRPRTRIKLPNNTAPGEIPSNKQVDVVRYQVVGSTVFSEAELVNVTQPFVGKGGVDRLQNARTAVEKLYSSRGYLTTGVFVAPGQEISKPGVVIKLEVQEGKISEIKVVGTQRINQDYIRNRLRIDPNKPFNYDELTQAVGILKEDPIVGGIDAEVLTGSKPGTNIVVVTVTEKQTAAFGVSTNNNQSANFGDWQRTARISENSLIGGGESVSAYFGNTAGSTSAGGRVSVPLNSQDTRLSLSVNNFASRLILEQFQSLNITSNTLSYDLSLWHPLVRRVGNNGFYEELSVGFSVGKSQTTGAVNEVPTPLTEGADNRGNLNLTTLNFSQDYFQKTDVANFSLNSNLRVGIDALGATPSQGAIDGRFVSWQGNGSYLRNIGSGNELVVQGGLQLADRPLLSLVQAQPYLPGYSQGILINDNAAYASTELRLPIVNNGGFTLKAIPSLYFGTSWGSIQTTEPNTLASAGLGLQLAVTNFNARLDWGVPLVFTNASKDNRLTFQVGYTSSF